MRSVKREFGDKELNLRMKLLARRRKRITQPSVVEGLAQIIDIAGTMQDDLEPFYYRGHGIRSAHESRGWEDDAKKLASDWYKIQQQEWE